MSIREQARAVGGDELVAQLDRAAALEKVIFTQVSEIVEQSVKGLTGREEQAMLAAVCEALSSALANATAVLTIKAFKGSQSDGVITAVRSLSANITRAFEDLDAVESSVATKIMEAAGKGGK